MVPFGLRVLPKVRNCEPLSGEAIPLSQAGDCFASLAMTVREFFTLRISPWRFGILAMTVRDCE